MRGSIKLTKEEWQQAMVEYVHNHHGVITERDDWRLKEKGKFRRRYKTYMKNDNVQ